MGAGAYEAYRMIRGDSMSDELSFTYPDFSLMEEAGFLRRHARRNLVSALE